MSTLKVNALQTTSGAQLSRVIQTVRAIKTDTSSFSINTLSIYDDTNFSISITPTVSSNLIYVFGHLTLGLDGDNQDIAVGVKVNGSDLNDVMGDARSSRRRAHSGCQENSGGHGAISVPINVMYVPNSTSQQTINFRYSHGSGGTRTLYINRTERDSDNAENATYVSQIIAQELVP